MESNHKSPKFFGCFPQKGLLLKLQSFRSKGSSSNSSSTTTSTSPRSSPQSPLPTTRKFRNTREEEFRQVFCCFDADNDGKISAIELRSYFASIGEYMSHKEAEAVIDDLDTDGDSLIDFGDFMKVMNMDGKGDDDQAEDVKAAFETFEVEKGAGRIDAKSLQRALNKLGDSRSYDECVDIIRVIDTHGKGAVDFNEFQEMMMA